VIGVGRQNKIFSLFTRGERKYFSGLVIQKGALKELMRWTKIKSLLKIWRGFLNQYK